MNLQNKDEDPKRATFGVSYPSTDSIIVFAKKEDFKNIPNSRDKILNGKKVVFEFERANKEDCTFEKCQFYVESQLNQLISKITFRRCAFNSCFMGSVTFKGVRFENVDFSGCDFSNSVFETCVFDNCTFKKCSAYHPEFINTEIDPERFLSGICLLSDNYEQISSRMKDEFVYMKYNLSKKIYNSNSSIDNHFLSDIGLYELKVNEVKYLYVILQEYLNRNKYWGALKILVSLGLKYLNLKVTKGGTSLIRLFCYIAAILILFNFYFYQSGIREPNYSFVTSNNKIVKFFEWFPRTTSIFLSYGYTAFKDSTFGHFIMVNLCAFLGIISYALVISILIRKIYK